MSEHAEKIVEKTGQHLKTCEPEVCETCALYWDCFEAGETVKGGCNQWREVLS